MKSSYRWEQCTTSCDCFGEANLNKVEFSMMQQLAVAAQCIKEKKKTKAGDKMSQSEQLLSSVL